MKVNKISKEENMQRSPTFESIFQFFGIYTNRSEKLSIPALKDSNLKSQIYDGNIYPILHMNWKCNEEQQISLWVGNELQSN